ncbi:hypothetical protein [Deinococcus kurensis]|uniref:hypothetical protein n=1 Tax=Deinococcus kurensis TaxID=2662757 RepID=UPI0012D2C80A|nr:hypothetical protein [Deinococcus kurensis]
MTHTVTPTDQLTAGTRIRWNGETVRLTQLAPHRSVPGWTQLRGEYERDGRAFSTAATELSTFEVLP